MQLYQPWPMNFSRLFKKYMTSIDPKYQQINRIFKKESKKIKKKFA
jgi:catalase (peroxidase I)